MNTIIFSQPNVGKRLPGIFQITISGLPVDSNGSNQGINSWIDNCTLQ